MLLSSDFIKLRFAPSSLAIRKSCTQGVNNKSRYLMRYAAFSRIGLYYLFHQEITTRDTKIDIRHLLSQRCRAPSALYRQAQKSRQG